MTSSWFGWRVVTKPRGGFKAPGIWHAFKRDFPGSRSLCGRVTFGRERGHRGGRPCQSCSVLWTAEYPKTGPA